jgi:hypothetical protein
MFRENDFSDFVTPAAGRGQFAESVFSFSSHEEIERKIHVVRQMFGHRRYVAASGDGQNPGLVFFMNDAVCSKDRELKRRTKWEWITLFFPRGPID